MVYVAVFVELRDYIKADKYNTVLDTSFSIYEITIDKPSKYFLKNEKQLVYFAHEFCDLLNEIQAIHGRNTPIHLLTAIPTAISIKIGLTLLPTKDQPIHIYDYSPQKGFQKVIIL